MDDEHVKEFRRDGLTCIRGAVSTIAVKEISGRLWEIAESKRGICRDDRSSWERVPPAITKSARANEGLFDAILSDEVCRGIDALVGEGQWERPELVGQLLMTPPDARTWTLPNKVWHTDFPAPGWVGNVLPGVQIFVLLDRLEVGQGGTLVVAGSHRLTAQMPQREDEDFPGHSAQIRKALQGQVPWVRGLFKKGPADARIQRFMLDAEDHEGVPLRVVEMTGEPGDVYFMHLWNLHNASPNCGDRMRMMAIERFVSKGVRLYEFNRGL